MLNLLQFGHISVYSHFPLLHTLPLSPSLFTNSALSHSTSPLPFPKEVNKKLSYLRQNALGIVKHTSAIIILYYVRRQNKNKKTQQYKMKNTQKYKKIIKKTIKSKSDYATKASPNGPLNIYVGGLPRRRT